MIAVKFKRLDPDAQLPRYATPFDAGADVFLPQDIVLEPNRTTVIGCGFAVEIPEGYELQVRPRSSLALAGLLILNSPGTIDSGYRGQVKIIMRNAFNDTNIFLHKGDKIAQLVLQTISQASYIESDELSESVRGTGGLGSTGK